MANSAQGGSATAGWPAGGHRMPAWQLVLATVFLGVASGAAVVYFPLPLAVTGGLALLGFGLLRVKDWGGVVVGSYWATLAVKSVVFSEVSVPGLFFPFYGGFVVVIGIALIRAGLRVAPLLFWSICVFLGLVVASFIGSTQPVDSVMVQKLMALLICPLVLLSIQARAGLRVVALLAVAAGVGIAAWVISNSYLSGFEYRAGVEVNQNVAAFILGGCLVPVLASLLSRSAKGRGLSTLTQLVLSGGMAYGLLLLASRGMTAALAIAVAFMVIHVISWRKRILGTLLLLCAILASGLLLPGGQGLIDRLEVESVDSAGDRTPLWVATIDALTDSGTHELLLGHGFNSSQDVVNESNPMLTSTHNAYLSMAYELGVLGLLAFLTLHAGALVLASRVRNVYGVMATGLVWLLLGSNLTATMTDLFMYWLLLGAAMAIASFGGDRSDPVGA